MDWLDETIESYEKKTNEEKKAWEKEKQEKEEKLYKNKQVASEALTRAYKHIYNLKKELSKRKYPSNADLQANKNVQTGEQINTGVVLLVSHKKISHDEKLSNFNSHSLVIKTTHEADKFIIEEETSKGQKVPDSNKINVSELTDEFIDTLTRTSIEQIFS